MSEDGRVLSKAAFTSKIRQDTIGIMSQTQTTSILERMLDPFSRCFNAESARRLSEFQYDPTLIQRVEHLAGQANEGLLTPEEREEYELFVDTDDIIAIIKIKAHRYLKDNSID